MKWLQTEGRHAELFLNETSAKLFYGWFNKKLLNRKLKPYMLKHISY